MSIFCEPVRLCPCGSGLSSWWLYDARGIECGRVCPECEGRKRAQYRPDIFTNPNYDCDEDIDPD
jgi:hypothetical protein